MYDSLGESSAEGTDYDITIVVGETIGGSMDYYGISGVIHRYTQAL